MTRVMTMESRQAIELALEEWFFQWSSQGYGLATINADYNNNCHRLTMELLVNRVVWKTHWFIRLLVFNFSP